MKEEILLSHCSSLSLILITHSMKYNSHKFLIRMGKFLQLNFNPKRVVTIQAKMNSIQSMGSPHKPFNICLFHLKMLPMEAYEYQWNASLVSLSLSHILITHTHTPCIMLCHKQSMCTALSLSLSISPCAQLPTVSS